MIQRNWEQVRETFLECLEVDQAQRAAFLQKHCGDDSRFRSQVEELLAAHSETGDFMEHVVTQTLVSTNLTDPEQIGPYRILERIGEGGMGIVYAAEQREPVQRKVALKVIKHGMDTQAVIARFAAEQQALALMDHRSIARVFDAGATEGGRPYFVMEYVAGDRVTEYCDRERLDTVARLRLFQEICEAVQHAHQKGVIHRDIKPSNILVEVQDGKPLVKIIDFGVAKSTQQRLTEKTLFTALGQIIGTPEYMSPEQAEMTTNDVDTRTDVYSLGVVLYELLVGVLPFDSTSLRKAGYAEIQRIIRELEPSKPSARMSSLGADASDSALARRSDSRALVRKLRGDLDWIVMRCLEKDRTRRYASASELAADIGRHLSHEPVLAGPPGAGYKLKKFMRKNRGLVTATAVVFIALCGGLAAASYGLIQEAKRAEELQLVADFQARQLSGIDVSLMGIRLRKELLASVRAASERAQQSDQATEERVAQLEKLIAGADLTGVSLSMLDENVFVTALKTINEQFAEHPLLQATLFQTLANTLLELGLLDRATEPQERALAARRRVLGDDHPDTLNSICNMGMLLEAQGELEEAEPYCREAMETSRRVLGVEHHNTLTCINNMGLLLQSQGKLEEAERYYREALETRRRVLGDEHPDTLISINSTGILLQSQGKLEEAEPYHREALETRRRVLGDEHPSTLNSINNMGYLLQNQGKLEEAKPYYREALEIRRRVLGDKHTDTLTSISNMGYLLQSQGKLEQAETYTREALETRRLVLGDEHSDTLASINNMGYLLQKQGKLEEAEPYYQEAVETSRRVLGDEHSRTSASINNMGLLLHKQGKLEEAEPYTRLALETARHVLGDEHPDTLTSMNNMGSLLQGQGKLEEAEPYLRKALETRRRVLGDEHPHTLTSINNMGSLLRDLGRLEDAERLGEEAVRRGRKVLAPRHWFVGVFLFHHGRTLLALKRYSDAASRLEEAYSTFSEALGDEHKRTSDVLPHLVSCYGAWHEAEPDAGHEQKLAQWRAKLEAAEAAEDETKQ